ncbi:hypothetical protein ACS0TY_031019 [Phlomoides rotata]
MEGGGSSSLGLKKNGKKTDRNRRAWTPVEELVLVDLMKDLVTQGWRSENGFKPGYLQKLEAGMVRKLPGTDIRAVPHITSRITIWKKSHGSLQTMLAGNSGIGFNTATGMIDCHNDSWALIVKADPNATNMRYKSWPLFEDWKEIFGMERANGAVAEDVMQAVNNLESGQTSQGGMQNETNVEVNPTNPDPAVDLDVTSEAPAVDRVSLSKVSGKKRPAGESSGSDKICNVLGKLSKSSDARMDSLVRAIGYDLDVSNARKEVFSVLDGMVDITEDEKVDAAHWFGKNADCLDVFMGMTEASRARYVRRLLTGQIKL